MCHRPLLVYKSTMHVFLRQSHGGDNCRYTSYLILDGRYQRANGMSVIACPIVSHFSTDMPSGLSSVVAEVWLPPGKRREGHFQEKYHMESRDFGMSTTVSPRHGVAATLNEDKGRERSQSHVGGLEA